MAARRLSQRISQHALLGVAVAMIVAGLGFAEEAAAGGRRCSDAAAAADRGRDAAEFMDDGRPHVLVVVAPPALQTLLDAGSQPVRDGLSGTLGAVSIPGVGGADVETALSIESAEVSGGPSPRVGFDAVVDATLSFDAPLIGRQSVGARARARIDAELTLARDEGRAAVRLGDVHIRAVRVEPHGEGAAGAIGRVALEWLRSTLGVAVGELSLPYWLRVRVASVEDRPIPGATLALVSTSEDHGRLVLGLRADAPLPGSGVDIAGLDVSSVAIVADPGLLLPLAQRAMTGPLAADGSAGGPYRVMPRSVDVGDDALEFAGTVARVDRPCATAEVELDASVAFDVDGFGLAVEGTRITEADRPRWILSLFRPTRRQLARLLSDRLEGVLGVVSMNVGVSSISFHPARLEGSRERVVLIGDVR